MILRALGFLLLLTSHTGALAAPDCCLEVAPDGCCTPDGSCADAPDPGCALAASPLGASIAPLRVIAADAGLLAPAAVVPDARATRDASASPTLGDAPGFPAALAFSSLRN